VFGLEKPGRSSGAMEPAGCRIEGSLVILNQQSHIAVCRAGLEQKAILRNLLELYAHDFSSFVDLEIGQDGRFGYEGLDLYWTDADRHPFLVTVDQKIGGFILVDAVRQDEASPTTWDVAEFFILRSYRRRGIGTSAAHQVFKRFPGHWQVRVRLSNQPACNFWKHAIVQFAAVRSARMVSGGAMRQVFTFDSPPVDGG
jgi:predicted acetyltransferase